MINAPTVPPLKIRPASRKNIPKAKAVSNFEVDLRNECKTCGGVVQMRLERLSIRQSLLIERLMNAQINASNFVITYNKNNPSGPKARRFVSI